MINLAKKIYTEGWQQCRPSFLPLQHAVLCLLLVTVFFSCEKTESAKIQIYEGPVREAENMEMLYSEKDVVTIKVKAKKVSEFLNGDRNFPEGIYIEFYGDNGQITSTLSANTAFYNKKDNSWKGQGKVEVKNIEKDEQLSTEELFWYPGKKKINTDKFVTIRNGREVIYGTGLDAKQDMSEYNILKPEGEFAIEE